MKRTGPGTQAKTGIATIAARYDLSMRTLRFYEELGLIQPVRGPYERLYTAQDEIRLQLILKGKRFGFSLGEIGRLIGRAERSNARQGDDLLDVLDTETIVKQVDQLLQRRAQIDRAIVELRAALDPACGADGNRLS